MSPSNEQGTTNGEATTVSRTSPRIHFEHNTSPHFEIRLTRIPQGINPQQTLDVVGLRERARLAEEQVTKIVTDHSPDSTQPDPLKHARLMECVCVAVSAVIDEENSVKDIVDTWAQEQQRLFRETAQEGLDSSERNSRFLDHALHAAHLMRKKVRRFSRQCSPQHEDLVAEIMKEGNDRAHDNLEKYRDAAAELKFMAREQLAQQMMREYIVGMRGEFGRDSLIFNVERWRLRERRG